MGAFDGLSNSGFGMAASGADAVYNAYIKGQQEGLQLRAAQNAYEKQKLQDVYGAATAGRDMVVQNAKAADAIGPFDMGQVKEVMGSTGSDALLDAYEQAKQRRLAPPDLSVTPSARAKTSEQMKAENPTETIQDTANKWKGGAAAAGVAPVTGRPGAVLRVPTPAPTPYNPGKPALKLNRTPQGVMAQPQEIPGQVPPSPELQAAAAGISNPGISLPMNDRAPQGMPDYSGLTLRDPNDIVQMAARTPVGSRLSDQTEKVMVPYMNMQAQSLRAASMQTNTAAMREAQLSFSHEKEVAELNFKINTASNKLEQQYYKDQLDASQKQFATLQRELKGIGGGSGGGGSRTPPVDPAWKATVDSIKATKARFDKVTPLQRKIYPENNAIITGQYKSIDGDRFPDLKQSFYRDYSDIIDAAGLPPPTVVPAGGVKNVAPKAPAGKVWKAGDTRVNPVTKQTMTFDGKTWK